MTILNFRWITGLFAGGLLVAASVAPAQDKKADEKPAAPAVQAPATPANPGPAIRPDRKTARIESRLRGLNQTLSLTDDQKAKIRPIVEEEMGKVEELQQDKTLSNPERAKKFREIREASQTKLRPFLTPEQVEKLDARQNLQRKIPANPAPAAPNK
jgi:Spy/CpxP family protein refolding chaperone